MSQDITSTLKIADGFTEPLTNLAKQLATADNLATALAKTLKDQMEIFSKSTDEIIEHVAAYADYLIPNLDIVDVNLKKIDKSFGKIAKASRKAFEKSDSSITKIKESAINSSKYIGRSFVQTFRPFTDSLKSIGLNAKISASVIREEFGSLKNVVGVNFKMATVDGKVIWSQFINDMRLSMPMAMKSSFNNVYSTIKSGTRLSASQVKDGMIRAFEGFKGPTGFGAKLQLAIKNPINTINGEIPKLEKNFSKVSKTIEKQGKKFINIILLIF